MVAILAAKPIAHVLIVGVIAGYNWAKNQDI